MRKLSLVLLVLLVLVGCGDDSTEEKAIVKDEVTEAAKQITWEKDGSQMALIPAGSFKMGDHLDGMVDAPVHTVELDGFYMDVNEVTVGQFFEFVKQSGYSIGGGKWGDVARYSPGDNYPMVLVHWNHATAYAKWVGKRLPTEAEWEYAARGRLVGKRYSWTSSLAAHDYANYKGTGGKDKWKYCSPVGSFEANGYGLYDMAGNVREWGQDWYGKDYYSKSPVSNPQGPSTGKSRVLRGGSWNDDANGLRVASRFSNNPATTDNDFGFRCVSGPAAKQ